MVNTDKPRDCSIILRCWDLESNSLNLISQTQIDEGVSTKLEIELLLFFFFFLEIPTPSCLYRELPFPFSYPDALIVASKKNI